MTAILAALLIAAETTAVSDTEIWNEGVEFYRNGDVTNALRVLKPLVLTRNYGARAAEVVAKLSMERGEREEAAHAAQIALRAAPDDAKANRNFTRAIDGLEEARKAQHVDEVIKAAQGKDPGQLLQAATYDARTLFTESGTYRTNAAERAIAQATRLSACAEKLTDAWLPLREVITQSVTNQEQAATILAQLDQAQDKTKRAAQQLDDLDPEAYSTLSEVEHKFTQFFKLVANPPAAISEDLIAQSNAWQDVEAFNGRSWQADALDYTRAFRAKFPAWARAYEQQAQADTNKPPFTAEDQNKISALATQLEKLQLECAEKTLPPQQEEALNILRQIEELLPKDKNSGGGQGQPQANQQKQDQQQKDDQKDDQQQNQQQDPKQDEAKGESNDEQQEEQPDEKDSADEKEPSQEERDIEATLRKAEERNDEHEADKKARMRKAPLPPNERDW